MRLITVFLILALSIIALVIFLFLFGWYTHYEFTQFALCVGAITYGLRLFMLHVEARRLAALVLLAPIAVAVAFAFSSPEWKAVKRESPLRVGPGVDYTAIETLPRDALITALGTEEGWTRVLVKGGPPLEGYVRSSSLSFLWSSPNVAGPVYLCMAGAALWVWTYFGEFRVRRWRMRRALRREVIAELKKRYAENWEQRVHIAVPVAVELAEKIISAAATKAQSEIEVRWLRSQLNRILREVGIDNSLDPADVFSNTRRSEIDYKPLEGGRDDEQRG